MYLHGPANKASVSVKIVGTLYRLSSLPKFKRVATCTLPAINNIGGEKEETDEKKKSSGLLEVSQVFFVEVHTCRIQVARNSEVFFCHLERVFKPRSSVGFHYNIKIEQLWPRKK